MISLLTNSFFLVASVAVVLFVLLLAGSDPAFTAGLGYDDDYEDTRGSPVVVVGAGTAGLAAAATLREAGVPVVVLEGRSRVGGRIHTHHFTASASASIAPVELGATFVHFRSDTHELLSRSTGGVDSHGRHSQRDQTDDDRDRDDRVGGPQLVHYNYSSGTYFDRNGVPFSDAAWDDAADYWSEVIFDDFDARREALYENTSGVGDEPMSTTLDDLGFYDDEEFTDEERQLFDLLCFQHIVQDMQSPVQLIGAFSYDGTYETTIAQTHDYVIANGYDGLLTPLLDGIAITTVDDADIPGSAQARILLNTTVSRISLPQAESCEAVTSWLGFVLDEVFWLPDVVVAAVTHHTVATTMDDALCAFLGAWRQLRASSSIGSIDDVVVSTTRRGEEEQDETNAQEGEELRASVVIVTIPVGVLKSSDVEFDPPLPGYVQHAVAGLGLSNVTKVALCWQREDVFWPSNQSTESSSSSSHLNRTLFFFKHYPVPSKNSQKLEATKDNDYVIEQDGGSSRRSNASVFEQLCFGTGGRYGKGCHLEFINFDQLNGNGCLVAGMENTLATRAAARFGSNGTAIAEHILLPALQSMFGHQKDIQDDDDADVAVKFPSRGVFVSEWTTHPFTKGGYSHRPVDISEADSEDFGFAIARQLFFAGEHASSEMYGNVQGAYETGVQAARNVLEVRWTNRLLRRGLAIVLFFVPALLVLVVVAFLLLRRVF